LGEEDSQSERPRGVKPHVHLATKSLYPGAAFPRQVLVSEAIAAGAKGSRIAGISLR